MAQPDKVDEKVVLQAYRTLLRSDLSTSGINPFEKLLARAVTGHFRHRIYAGQVMIELVRIAQATGKPPSTGAAIRLVAWNQFQHSGTSSIETLEREVRAGFSDFRNTSHLQASITVFQEEDNSSWLDDTNVMEHLGFARALEEFFDANVVTEKVKWNPWRVPASVPPIYTMSFRTLSPAELDTAIGLR
ncbi:hypothetical protein [Frigidibacter sp. ROC022]|uniref:hypothetical protein n=1 Tax=Frigidibacter sp. ROC022 TaxID=2971796 RepID=UPI00215A2108|nr:hypothetical protein [Frigidibacter sp. ROC022]MCR8724553.1 hypothetical protein [Frigidibacter sp. ROC022]